MRTVARRVTPVLLAAACAVLAIGTGTASAHGDEGEMTVTKLEQVGPTTVAVEVGIVYAGDGHLAEDASVSATLSGPDGATVGPVQLTRTGEGTSLYAATVEVPGTGDWSVAVTSTEPEGAATQTIAVAEQAPPTDSDAMTTTEVADAAASGDAATTDPAELDPAPVTTTSSATDEESSPNLALLVGASLVLSAIVIGGAVLVARRRTAADAAAGD